MWCSIISQVKFKAETLCIMPATETFQFVILKYKPRSPFSKLQMVKLAHGSKNRPELTRIGLVNFVPLPSFLKQPNLGDLSQLAKYVSDLPSSIICSICDNKEPGPTLGEAGPMICRTCVNVFTMYISRLVH